MVGKERVNVFGFQIDYILEEGSRGDHRTALGKFEYSWKAKEILAGNDLV